MTFLNPFMLFGLVAAAIPIILHLLNLRKLRTVEFSSLRFLKELQRSSVRRVKIRQWLLLLLRTLLIAALVLAFSRPAMRGSLAGLAGGKASTTMVVLLDDSPSMTVRNDRGVLFNQARDAAARLSTLIGDGDQFYLVRLSDLRHQEQFIPLRSREAVAPALSAMTPSQERVPFPQALRAAARMLAASVNPNQEVYLITDGQATQFTPDSAAADTGAAFDARTRAFLLTTGTSNPQNSAVTSAEVTTRIIARNRPVQLQAMLRNFGGTPANGEVASVYVEGTRMVQQTVDLPGEGSATITGKFLPRRAGALGGYVQIEDDALEADNRRFFTLSVPQNVSVLLVGNTPADTRFVNLGLTLAGDSSLAGVFSVKRILETELPTADLSAVDVVVLCNVRGFSETASEHLARFVRTGGGLMIFPGSQSNIPNYNETLFARLDLPSAAPMWGAPRTGAADNDTHGSVTFQRVDVEHPLFAGLFEEQRGRRQGSIESPHVYAAVSPGIGQRGHAVITLSNGTGFLVEYAAGEGRVLFCAVEAGMSWSDLPVQGIFAPLLYRSALYLSSREQGTTSFTVGQPLECTLRLRNTTGREGFTCTSPSGVVEKLIPEFRGASGTALFRTSRSSEAGIYELRRSAGPAPAAPHEAGGAPLATMAVNIDPAESDLRQADDARIRNFWNSLGLPAANTGVLAAGQSIDTAVEQSRYGVELWRHFLGLALVLALIEMAVGRERRSETTEGQS